MVLSLTFSEGNINYLFDNDLRWFTILFSLFEEIRENCNVKR